MYVFVKEPTFLSDASVESFEEEVVQNSLVGRESQRQTQQLVFPK